MLRDNLVRNGVDLTVDTNLTYFDVNNRRVGINTILPSTDLDVNGNIRANSVTADSVFITNVFGNTNVLNKLYSDNSVIANLFVSGNLLVPVGDNHYPNTAVAGQIRYNNQTDFFEYYDGYTWNKIAKEGDLSAQITSDLFYGNNVANSFTLSQNSTTQGTFVSINGVLQQPGQSYVVSDNLLTFVTETPVDTDVIEARAMTVNSQVGKIQNGTNWVSAEYQPDATGIVNIGVDGDYAMQVTGSLVTIHNPVVYHINSLTVGTGGTVIDQLDNSLYHAAKYIVSGVDDAHNNYHAMEALVIHNGNTARVTVYAQTNIGSNLLTLDVFVLNGYTNLRATSSTDNVTVRISKSYLPA